MIYKRVRIIVINKFFSWCDMVVDFYVPHTIQLDSLRNMILQWYRWHVIHFVANVNVNSDGLNVNVNHLENSNIWNAEYAHRLVVPHMKNFLLDYYGRGVFISNPFFHPPIILPSSWRSSDNIMYFWLSSNFTSQEIMRKNLSASNLRIVLDKLITLFSTFWYVARLRSSNISKNNLSILSPRV